MAPLTRQKLCVIVKATVLHSLVLVAGAGLALNIFWVHFKYGPGERYGFETVQERFNTSWLIVSTVMLFVSLVLITNDVCRRVRVEERIQTQRQAIRISNIENVSRGITRSDRELVTIEPPASASVETNESRVAEHEFKDLAPQNSQEEATTTNLIRADDQAETSADAANSNGPSPRLLTPSRRPSYRKPTSSVYSRDESGEPNQLADQSKNAVPDKDRKEHLKLYKENSVEERKGNQKKQ
ncbi:hypothetical protein RUND412_007645 [Rhizina undulata]